MSKDFIICLQEFIDQRVGIACDYCHDEDPEYKKKTEEANALYDKIKILLGPENDKLIFKFNFTKEMGESVYGDRAYVQGLSDGLRMKDYICQKIAAGGKNVFELYYTDQETRSELDFSLESLFLEEEAS